MFRRTREKLRVFWYVRLLDQYGALLPEDFFSSEQPDKYSKAFEVYKKLIHSYITTLVEIRKRGPAFIQELQEKRLRQTLRIASTIHWWNGYFKEKNIDL